MRFDQVKEALVSAAVEAGLEEYEIYYMRDTSLGTETLKNEISSFNSGVGGGVCFRCIYKGQLGYASSELLEVEEMQQLVKRAMSNAENMDSDEEACIYSGSEKYTSLEAEANNIELVPASLLKDAALKMQKNTYDYSKSVADGTQSGAMTSRTDIELINSHGLYLSNSVGMSGSYVQAVVSVDGVSEDEFEFVEGVSADDEDGRYKELSKKAVDGALRKLGASEIDSGKYDIVFSGKQMRAMLSAFSDVFSGKEAYNGMSLLNGKVGEKVAADCITLVDDPMRSGCSMKTHFDGEGVATYRKKVIDGGVLKTLLYDLATAKKVGTESTGNGQRASYTSPVSISPYSFYIEGGTKDLDELLGGVEKGIYVTELKGLHAGADSVTGDFSIESAGFLIENGKLGKAVKSFTVAGNFFDLLKNIEDISDKVEFGIPTSFTIFGAPDVLVRQMSVAGK